MSSTTDITLREPETVTIGPVSLVCDSMKMSSAKAISEETSVSGAEIVTNSGKRVLKISFSGRIHTECSPMNFLLFINNLMPAASGLNVTYRGLRFNGCQILAFNAEDTGEDWTAVTVTLATAQNIALEE